LDDSFDESAVRACRRGDKAAYALLVQKHYKRVFALCFGMLARVHDAEDMAQETLLKGFRSIGSLGKAEQFESWILRIARNACIDFLRKQKRAGRVPVRAYDETPDGVTTNGDCHDLEQAIRKLPQELRLPLTLYYFEHKNAHLIGEMLGISHSLVCQRIREARNRLHRFLTERGCHE
jgi:RNA polymerase sigma-70 factor, ECF subfamily